MKGLLSLMVLLLTCASIYAQNYSVDDTSIVTVNEGVSSYTSAWCDINNDSYTDLFIGNYYDKNNFLYMNQGNNYFVKVDTGAITTDGGNTQCAIWGDYNNDGFPDLFVANYKEANILYKNNGDGSFSTVTNSDFLDTINESWAAVWFDYNEDGYLDLYVVNNSNNKLYRNNGDGTFTRILSNTLVNDSHASYAVTTGDYNNDGYVDVFVANYGNQNNDLYKNNGDGSFTKITSGPEVSDGGQSRSCSFGDYNNDGYLDLFVANTGQDNFLYKNNGDGTFTKITTAPPVQDSAWTYCSFWDDYNNDGYLDLFLTNSTTNDSVTVYKNLGDGTFMKLKDHMLYGAGSSSWNHSLCDINNNGSPDVLLLSRAAAGNYLFVNNDSLNNFIGFHLIGKVSNYDAIGAEMIIYTDTLKQKRHITTQNGRASQGGFRMRFGLGKYSKIDSAKIFWPSGEIQKLNCMCANQYYTIHEDQNYENLNVHYLDTLTICAGDSVMVFNKYQRQPGNYFDTLQTSCGCDSINVIPLLWYNTDTSYVSKEICQGDSILMGGKYQTESGIYYDTLTSIHGCDSILTTNLTVHLPYEVSVDTMICSGDSILLEGSYQTIAGTYYDTLVSINGCDSIITTRLNFKDCITGITSSGQIKPLVYPTPTNGVIHIQADNIQSVEIYDITGNKILTTKDKVIDLTGYHNGIYLLKIYTNNEVEAVKVLLSK